MFSQYFNKYAVPAFLLSAAIMITSSPALARHKQALDPKEVAKIAKSTSVLIKPSGGSPGSGVIIGRYKEGEQNVYVVLTAKHVVEYADDQYTVKPPKLKGYKREIVTIPTAEDIEKIPNVDLAIVRFRSNQNYNTATLGNSKYVQEGSGVYVAGYPDPGLTIGRKFQFTGSEVSSRLDDDDDEPDDGQIRRVDLGYAIVYTAVTKAGMSGGPVFDVSGRLIAIHGRGDKDGPAKDKNGFNEGIPIQTFLSEILKLVPDAQRKLGLNLDMSEPGVFPGIVGTRAGESKVPPGKIDFSEDDDGGNDVPESGKTNSYIPPSSVTNPPISQENNSPTPQKNRRW